MDFTETTLLRKDIFGGHVVRLHVDKVRLSDGSQSEREVVDHRGGVAVLPIDEDGFAYCVRQYRYAMGEHVLEAPAGALEPEETPLDCAMRELREETGFSASSYHYLGEIYPSPGYCREVLHAYVATGLEEGARDLDEGEILETEKISFDELYEMALNGEIKDAKTIIAVLKAKEIIGRRG